MNYQLCGFLIGKEIHFDFEKQRLYRLPSSSFEKDITFATVFLNDTMLHFFLYLLLHARDREIPKDEVLKILWEENNLTPSTQRLWQILKELNRKLTLLGLPDNFILNSKGRGYFIKYPDIKPIYTRKN
ncbi:helix-turn-helix domain-containing protein [Rahnella bruchi]|uniref:helix-turn-helix domain-containing protein n=1 Tax=Rahnella bruchi TaxID=1510573 RepID=UPI000EA2D19F|nr:helix-turn-helix domain-containing protein [Rahnella bruchi]